jgi:hypothetical protein
MRVIKRMKKTLDVFKGDQWSWKKFYPL